MASSTIFTLKYSKHPELYIDTVTFLVENCLFKIPRKPLEEESAVFRDMFRLPQPKNKMMEGQNDARPLVASSIFGQNKGLALDLTSHWISVLKLSTMWEFTNLRTTAMSWLDTDATLDHVEKIVLAAQYGTDEWLLRSLLALAKKPDPISVEEGRRLGLEVALKLASVREQLTADRVYGYDARRGYKLIQKVFEL
ncbi:hypothetical protein BKA82DRAFT_4459308 [Pisolithus tinctorius]|nr:hypothetical protein BKA82DRAFT_4459308 [Pisolithus tinctorius]